MEGDATPLKQLLREEPELIHARSIREHGATLLHYVAANGVEHYRQKTPKNIVEITKILLDAGAEIDATANVYGGGCTTLLLAATSVHPEVAGVQEALLQTLLDRGATLEQPSAAYRQTIVMACMANGRPKAAEFLVARGARLDLPGAAALGRLEVVKNFFQVDGSLGPRVTQQQRDEAFRYACEYGHNDVVTFLLERGADLQSHGGDGQTPLHCAVIGNRPETVRLLLEHKPPLEVENMYGGTVLGQALWSAGHSKDEDGFVAIIEALIAAGAKVPAKHVPINSRVGDLLRRHGSEPEPKWYWFGEKPRRRKT